MESNGSFMKALLLLVAAGIAGTFLLCAEPCAASGEDQEARSEAGPALEARQEAEALRQWERLDPQRRESLLRGHANWMALPAERREEIRRNLAWFRSLPPAQRERILDNYRTVNRLPNVKRREVLKSFRRWKAMSPQEREALRERHDRFLEDFTPQERRQLRRLKERWKDLPPEKRKELLQRWREKGRP